MVARSSKPLNLNRWRMSPVVPSTTSTKPSVLARASLVSSGENSNDKTGAGHCVAKLRAPVRAVEHVTKPKRGPAAPVPGGGAGAAPPQATLNPSWLQLAAATLCAAVPSISPQRPSSSLRPRRRSRRREPSILMNRPGSEPLGGRPRTRRTGGCPFLFSLSCLCSLPESAWALLSRRAVALAAALAGSDACLLEWVIARV